MLEIKEYPRIDVEDGTVARATGDKNYTAREKRLIAEVAAEKAKLEAAKAEIKVRDARLKELRQSKKQ